MGCCPSKHKAAKGADLSAYNEYPLTDKTDVDYPLSERPTSTTLPVYEDAAAKSLEAPNTVLMDRGDGQPMEHSDHESCNEYIAAAVEEDANQAEHKVAISVRPAENASPPEDEALPERSRVLPPIRIVHEAAAEAQSSPSRPLMAVMMPSPARSPMVSSPSKPPVNFEDMPINSMYHRIHTVEAEEMEAKRREELEQEAQRRQREIDEFRAAMLTQTEG